MALSHNVRGGGTQRGSARRSPRGNVNEIQRARLLGATVEAVAELGYARLTVVQVIARARVSRKTFYDLFLDRDDCFLAAFEQGVSRASALAGEAYGNERAWRDAVRAALARLLALIDEEEALARLCIVEALAAGERVLMRRAALVAEIAATIDRGRGQPGASQPPELISQAVVGAVFSVLHARLLDAREDEPFVTLLPALMSMIVLPYLGPRVSRAELGRGSVPSARNGGRRRQGSAADPLAGLDMRLTYRTVRVLKTIAAQPGASNREIALGSGISDQGQISKLLSRLARLGLVENRGRGQERGAANAWHLTSRGASVERATWSP
jgi:AcrR family transcriptional regulator/DNA-binding MarR family transcriptional regulator